MQRVAKDESLFDGCVSIREYHVKETAKYFNQLWSCVEITYRKIEYQAECCENLDDSQVIQNILPVTSIGHNERCTAHEINCPWRVKKSHE